MVEIYTIVDEMQDSLNFPENRVMLLSLATQALADIYCAVKWKSISKSKSSLDVFQHRLLTAASMPTISRVFEKLAHGLSIQATNIPAEVFLLLEKHEEKILKLFREETRLLTSLAYSESKRRREEKN